MENKEKKTFEALDDEFLDQASGGARVEQSAIPCPHCGCSIQVKGFFGNICPRCGKKIDQK